MSSNISVKDLQNSLKTIERIKESMFEGNLEFEKELLAFYYIAQKLNLKKLLLNW